MTGCRHPKVIDFGVAKATNQKLTEKTLFTQFATMIGTPAYMSPEQAEMSGLDVDTRSDIYSLGVLLYELLTGRRPLSRRGGCAASGLPGDARIIRGQRNPNALPRAGTLNGRRSRRRPSAVPSNRSKLTSLTLRGDLDWIVMKCLEKDRARRYETANGLAMDLQRHLEQRAGGGPAAEHGLPIPEGLAT